MATIPGRLAGTDRHSGRAERRLPALARGRLRREGEDDVPVRLANASTSGFMALADAPVRAGSRVRLELPFGPAQEAEVRWVLGRRIGCRLAGRFSRGQMALLTLLGAGGLPGGAGAAALAVAALLLAA